MFAGALILLILGWGLGRSLEPDSRSSLPRIAVHAAGGLTLFALVANSISYLTGTQWKSWVLVSVGLVVIAARHASRERLSSAIGDLGRLVKMLAWVLPPAIVLSFPMFHWGFWYAGEYNTDLFQYTLLASLAKEHSLLALRGSVEAGNAGLIAAGAGFEWRSIDAVLASVTSVVFMSTSLAAFATLGCIMFFLFALGIVAMVADRRSSIFEYALAALLLLNPLFVLLFVESYQSHYFFVALVPGLILAFKEAVTVSGEERGARLWVRIVFLAAIAAAASYPHFAALLGFALFLAALVAKVQIKLLLGVVARTVAVIVLVLNIGLLAMRQISEATRWEAGLNDIARYVLLDPYANWQLPSLAFGTTPYRWRWPNIDPEQYMGFLGGHLWELGQASWTPGALEAGAIALFIGGTLFLLNWSKSLRDVAFVSAIAVVAAFGVLMLYMGYQDSLYGALKVGWTAAALFVVVIASAIYRKGTVFVVVLLLIPLSVLWLRTDLLDRSTWLINREGSAALLSHSSAQPDITRVESVLREGPESVALLRGPQPLSGSDRDNVAYNQIRALVRDHGVPCRGCREYPLIASELTTTVECALDTDVIIRIGVSDRSRLCGKPRIVSGAFVEVYR